MARLYPPGIVGTVRCILILVALVAGAAQLQPAAAQGDATVAIVSPEGGDILQGAVEIRGTASSASFLSAELAFSYAADTTNTWFTIGDIAQPIIDAQLMTWDTTAISDGEYMLRLRLRTFAGTVEDALVEVQVRNYTSAAARTPAPSPTVRSSVEVGAPSIVRASPTVGWRARSTPTPFPANTASLTAGAIISGFARGALIVVAVCLIVGALLIRRRA